MKMVYNNMKIMDANIKSLISEFRHDIHMHPELSSKEYRTTQKIKEKLLEAKIDVIDYGLDTGVVAEIKGASSGPLIIIRGDIDALPIHEQSELSFKSVNNGVMHACGHDLHSAITLGTALLLKKNESNINGTIRILFQGAEETATGALNMIDKGVLKNVDAIFGIHNDPSMPIGYIGTKYGWLTANVDRFDLRIKAKGCHAGKPYEGIDPVIVIAQLISTLQTIVSRNIPSKNNAVLSITQVHSGETWNIIPDVAYMEGTVRTFGPATRLLVHKRMKEIIHGIEKGFNVKVNLGWYPGPPSVNNESQWVDFSLAKAKEMGFNAQEIDETPIGEDFGFFQEQVPGVFIMFGSGSEYPLHHPKYEVKDEILWPTCRYYSELAISSLNCLLKK